MNDNPEILNPKLREHVTSAAFSLQVPRSAIFALDAIAHGDYNRNRDRMLVDRFIPGCHSCAERGLIVHKLDPNFEGLHYKDAIYSTKTINSFYRLTRAGWLVHDLLAEAGMVEAVTSRKQRKLVA